VPTAKSAARSRMVRSVGLSSEAGYQVRSAAAG
jgi:hypothetical protein